MGSLEDRKTHSDCEDTPNGLSSFDGLTQRHSDKDGDKQSDPETDRGIRLGDLGLLWTLWPTSTAEEMSSLNQHTFLATVSVHRLTLNNLDVVP